MVRRFFRRHRTKTREVAVKIKLPFVGEFSGVWEPQHAESEAAWELYVELATRISVVELGRDDGMAREALSSLYTLFGSTREILRKYGPSVAPQQSKGNVTFGSLAVAVLNGTLRPLLSKWHPQLRSWESQCPADTDPVMHENSWDRISELRSDIEAARISLTQLADILSEVAGVAPLTESDQRIRQFPAQDDS